MREDLGDLTELCASIRMHGLLQPVVVRPRGQNFELICGNRRYEACRRLMKRHIDCIVRDLTDQQAYEVALVENVQRSTLSPLEEASAYKKYVSEFGWGGVTDLASKIGKSQEYVSHRISLLDLPEGIISMISSGKIHASQAQELVWAKTPVMRAALVGMLDEQSLRIKEIRTVSKDLEMGGVHSLPDFEPKCNGPRVSRDRAQSDRKVVEDTILGLRVALVRVDSAISKTLSEDVKSALMRERFSLHEMIDRLIRLKVSLSPD